MPLKPWDIRPESPTGDGDDNTLFAAVGRALTEWERIESSCAEVFAILVSAKGKSTIWAPAIQAYGTIISFRSRCEMLRAAAKSYFDQRPRQQQLKGTFKTLIDEALEFSNRRNEIAHGQVTSIVRVYEKGVYKNIGYILIPSLYNPKKFKRGSGSTYSYVSGDLIHYRQEFTKLHLRIEGLRAQLISARKKQKSFQKLA